MGPLNTNPSSSSKEDLQSGHLDQKLSLLIKHKRAAVERVKQRQLTVVISMM